MSADSANPVVLTASSSGGKWTLADSPHLAATADQIIQEMSDCADLGATMAHLHAREPDGKPTFDPSTMGYIVDGIRSRVDMVIQISTGNLPEELQALPGFLASKPELASFNLKDEVAQAKRRAELFLKLGVRPVIEVADLGMVETSIQFLDEGLFTAPLMFELVFELEESARSAREVLGDLLARVEAVSTVPDAVWSVTRGGQHRQMLAAAALGLGGWVRGGMEDSLTDRTRRPATSSAQLVGELVALVESMGMLCATPSQARWALGLSK